MKVKFSVEQNTKAQRGSRCIALLFLQPRRQMGWMVNATPWPLYPRERPGTHCTGGWVGPRDCLDGCGKFRPHRNSISRPSSPQRVTIATELSGPRCTDGFAIKKGKAVIFKIMKTYGASRIIAPSILNVCPRWRGVVNFTPRPIYPPEENLAPKQQEVGWKFWRR